MKNINAIVDCIDDFLERTGMNECTPPEANAELGKRKILQDTANRKGSPLRKILRQGLIPHAYKVGRYWHIPKSKGI